MKKLIPNTNVQYALALLIIILMGQGCTIENPPNPDKAEVVKNDKTDTDFEKKIVCQKYLVEVEKSAKSLVAPGELKLNHTVCYSRTFDTCVSQTGVRYEDGSQYWSFTDLLTNQNLHYVNIPPVEDEYGRKLSMQLLEDTEEEIGCL